MPTENEATPHPLKNPNKMTIGYAVMVSVLTVIRMNTKPHMPTNDSPNRVSIGRRPPTRSTQAPNGMRRSEPVSCGAATSRPRARPPRCIWSWKYFAAGP